MLNLIKRSLKKIRILRFLVILVKQYYFGFKLSKKGILLINDLNSAFNVDDNSKFIPAYGALLGLYRDGKFIKHDSDLDLFYLSEVGNFNIGEFEEMRLKLSNYFDSRFKGFEYIKNHNKIKVIIDKVPVDIHIAVFQSNSCFLTLKHNLEIHSLTRLSALGSEILIPENTEEILMSLYGPNWSIPDKTPYSSRGKWPFSD